MMNSRKHLSVFSTGVFAVMLVVASTNFAWADPRSDAQAQCERKLGQGATAEEELDFGEVSYVCNCANPYKWNSSNTRCVSVSGEVLNAEPKANQPDNNDSTDIQQLTASDLNQRGYEANKKHNYIEAVYWYRKAVDKGHADAMGNLARKYYSGLGVKQDYYEAFRLYEKSAQANVADSVASLGWLYYIGRGTRKDYAKAYKWSRKAAQDNQPHGMANLGILYEEGKGVRRDYSEALKWYKKSVEVGHTRAMRLLATLYDKGLGTRKDPDSAASLIIKALKARDKFTVSQMTTNSARWSRQFRRQLQRLMRDEGVYNGRIDGSFGNGTKRAIRKLAGK